MLTFAYLQHSHHERDVAVALILISLTAVAGIKHSLLSLASLVSSGLFPFLSFIEKLVVCFFLLGAVFLLEVYFSSDLFGSLLVEIHLWSLYVWFSVNGKSELNFQMCGGRSFGPESCKGLILQTHSRPYPPYLKPHPTVFHYIPHLSRPALK